jgi:hypothetical protein
LIDNVQTRGKGKDLPCGILKKRLGYIKVIPVNCLGRAVTREGSLTLSLLPTEYACFSASVGQSSGMQCTIIELCYL